MVFVYLLRVDINDVIYHKIGFTKREISKRIKQLKTGSVSEIVCIDFFKSKFGTTIEKNLHRMYRNKMVSGEWFLLDDIDIAGFHDKCQEIHDNLDFLDKHNTFINKF